jgi:hypothetical protein
MGIEVDVGPLEGLSSRDVFGFRCCSNHARPPDASSAVALPPEALLAAPAPSTRVLPDLEKEAATDDREGDPSLIAPEGEEAFRERTSGTKARNPSGWQEVATFSGLLVIVVMWLVIKSGRFQECLPAKKGTCNFLYFWDELTTNFSAASRLRQRRLAPIIGRRSHLVIRIGHAA